MVNVSKTYMDSNLQKIRELRAQQKEKNDAKVREFSKKQLLNNVTKKFKTTMIGALSAFENEFGELWGHGKNVEELNEYELGWRHIWDSVRTDILNKGNNQLRGALDEISQHDINKQKYEMKWDMNSPEYKKAINDIIMKKEQKDD